VEAFPSGFKSPLSHFWLLILLCAVSACTPTPEEAAGRFRLALERASSEPDEDVLSLLVPSSRQYLERASKAGQYRVLRERLLAALKSVKPGDSEGVVKGADGTSLFFVRDGHGRLLDLALSETIFAGLRDTKYPAPW